MSKILVVPDIHGRSFWEKPCQQWQGFIVFLGDYHDPYLFQVSKEKSLKTLEKLVTFVESNRNRCICLLGNHDANYLIYAGFANRVDTRNYHKVKTLISKLNPQIAHLIGDVLFSHAGALAEWLKLNDLSIEDLLTSSYDDVKLSKALEDISPYRGGHAKVGSILWGDIQEYDESRHVSNYYQIFGHTQLEKDPIIKKDYACLDCRQCFIIDTETKEIIPYE